MSEPEKRIRPIIILPEKGMTKADIAKLRTNGICVVEAKDPSAIRFAEPPPNGYSAQELAAINLCRVLLSRNNTGMWNRSDLGARFAQIIIDGTPLSENFIGPVKTVKK